MCEYSNLVLFICSFITLTLVQLSRINLTTFRDLDDLGTLATYWQSMSVNFISAISTISTFLFDWGGTCEDVFGLVIYCLNNILDIIITVYYLKLYAVNNVTSLTMLFLLLIFECVSINN